MGVRDHGFSWAQFVVMGRQFRDAEAVDRQYVGVVRAVLKPLIDRVVLVRTPQNLVLGAVFTVVLSLWTRSRKLACLGNSRLPSNGQTG